MQPKKKKKSIDEFLPGNIHTGLHWMHYLPAVCRSDDSSFELPLQQQYTLFACRGLSWPSCNQRRTQDKLGRHQGISRQIIVFCLKEPQYPPFDIKQSAFDPWTFDIPVKCPQSCFNCRSQLQSFGSGQEQPLLWLPSFCFAYQSSWQAAKSIPN